MDNKDKSQMTIAELMAKDAMAKSSDSVFFKKLDESTSEEVLAEIPEITPEEEVAETAVDSTISQLETDDQVFFKNAKSANNPVKELDPKEKVIPEHKNPPLEILMRLRELNMLVPGSQQNALYSDEYRRIKRPLISNAFGKTAQLVKNGNLILVTSSIPGEGKSYTALNLALSIAKERDHTVLLVDCDVAHKGASKMLKANDRPGLIEVLDSDSMSIGEVLVSTDIPSLSIIPAGQQHDFVTELLASHRMAEVVQEIGERYDDRIIIFDAPPVLPTPQTLVLTMLVGQIVFVVESGKTPQNVVLEAIEMLPEGTATALLMNKSEGIAKRKKSYYGYYGNE